MKITELSEKEKKTILEAREKEAKELAEKLEKERVVRERQKANMEDEKLKNLRSKKYEFTKEENAYNSLKSELAKFGMEKFVKMEVEEREENRHFRTWNRDLPYLEYKLKYKQATIYLIDKAFYDYDKPEIREYKAHVTVKGDLVKAYSITDNHRFIKPKTLVKELRWNHERAEARLKQHHEKNSKLGKLLEQTKEQFADVPNVESIERTKCYHKGSEWDSICITFKSKSRIYLGYRYSTDETHEVLKVDDRHEYDRTVEEWAEMFSKQEKK